MLRVMQMHCLVNLFHKPGPPPALFPAACSWQNVVRVLAALAGHASIQVMQRYIDVNADQLAQAVELL